MDDLPNSCLSFYDMFILHQKEAEQFSSQLTVDQIKLNIRLTSGASSPQPSDLGCGSSDISGMYSTELNRSPYPEDLNSCSLFSEEPWGTGRRTSAGTSQRR